MFVMLEKSFGLFFFLKKPKNEKGNARYIYLRLTVDGISKDVATKRQWDKLRWNPSAGRATGLKEDARALNGYLDVMCSKVYQAKKMLMDEDKMLITENLKNVLTGQAEEKRMILAQFKHHNEQMKALVGQEFAPSTLMRYKTAHDHAAAFIRWKYQTVDVELKDLNYEFVSQFAFWLKSVRKCGIMQP
ncbi:MAG: site-specific integrase [Mucilaginibacter sp.]|nr:site-specific integrase [Mucilaginibacter sp.]